MRHISTVLAFAALLLLSSCNDGDTPYGAGSWHFKGNLYYIPRVSPSFTTKTLVAESSTRAETDKITFTFQSYPPAAGTYSIVREAVTTATQVQVSVNVRSKIYATIADGSATATVTLNKAGQVSIKVPDATFANIGHTTDAGVFSADVVESYYE